jgi:thymidylate synthase
MKYKREDGTPFSKEEFLQKLKTDKEFNNEFGNKGIDQISELIRLLKESPDSRRMVVSAWAVHDLPNMVLPPCHYGFQVYTRELSEGERGLLLQPYGLDPLTKEGRDRLWKENNLPTRAISLMWNQRSCDVPLGIPMNIASYGLLLEIIAKLVNMVPDELIGNLGDCHIYLNQIEGTKEQIGREPFELPKLNINTEFWPYESGECGVGPIDSTAVLKSFNNDNFCKCLLNDDIQLSNYQYHPKIYFPLSN